jgi:hypothetical protein
MITKKKSVLFSLALLMTTTIIYSSCKKSSDDSDNSTPTTPAATSVTLSPSGVTVDQYGIGASKSKVTSPSAWTASCGQSWIILPMSTGVNGDSLFFIVVSNTSYSSRTATITVTSGSASGTLTITQLGDPNGANACTGNSSNSYYPLAQGYWWKYNYNDGGPLGGKDSIAGTQVYGGQTYFKFIVPDRFGGSPGYAYRRTAGNGDVYCYSTSDSREYLVAPANPVLNQKWLGPGTDSLKVTALSSTITTALCSYTSCLVVTEYYASGNFAEAYYYKKGYGLVEISYGSWGATTLYSLKVN